MCAFHTTYLVVERYLVDLIDLCCKYMMLKVISKRSILKFVLDFHIVKAVYCLLNRHYIG